MTYNSFLPKSFGSAQVFPVIQICLVISKSACPCIQCTLSNVKKKGALEQLSLNITVTLKVSLYPLPSQLVKISFFKPRTVHVNCLNSLGVIRFTDFKGWVPETFQRTGSEKFTKDKMHSDHKWLPRQEEHSKCQTSVRPVMLVSRAGDVTQEKVDLFSTDSNIWTTVGWIDMKFGVDVHDLGDHVTTKF